MQVINRSPAYRNQYVHRRDSVSLAMLSQSEIDERVKLGLIEGHTAEAEEEYEEEEWDDFDEDEMGTSREEMDSMDSSCDEEYILSDDRRKSSVEPSKTSVSPPGSSHDNHDFDMQGSGLPAKNLFTDVESSDRRQKRGKFSTIREEDEDSETSTVNGDDFEGEDPMEPFDDSENCEPGSSTTMSPALKRFTLEP